MYPNPQGCGQYLSRVGSGGSPPPLAPHNHHHPAAMIKAAHAINNNYPGAPAMASPFFMDNLLHHQKAAAAVNFQSQFVNSQLHNYIQEQHHQFLMHQNQMRQQHAMKYNQEQLKQNSESVKIGERQTYSRNNSPLSEEASPRNDYEDDEENFADDSEKACFRRPNKDSDTCTADFRNKSSTAHRKRVNTSPSIKEVSAAYDDAPEVLEETSRSPVDDQDRFTEDSPSGSPVNVRLQPAVKNEFQLSPTNYAYNNYADAYQKKDNHSEEVHPRSYGKDEPQDDHVNDSDQEVGRSVKKDGKSACSNCGSFECNPFYPACRNFGANSIRRYDGVERIYARHEDRSDVKNGDVNFGDGNVTEVRDGKDVGDNRDKDVVVKRCGTNLDSGQAQKPVLKFSVSAILGQDTGSNSDRSASANIVKIGHHDGFSSQVSGPGGVFALPLGGFSLAPIAKPIASRPPPYPQGAVPPPHPHHSLHSLLAHCRHHPYLTVGGVGGGGGGWGAAVGGGGFPWAGARGKPRRGMMRRAVFSDTQRRGLERRFQLQKYISKPDRKKLAEKLGLKDSQVKIWFQNRRMKWRNSKERELLASGGSREQTLPNKNNPHPDLSDAETDRPKLSPLSPQSAGDNDPPNGSEGDATKTQFDSVTHHDGDVANYRSYMNPEGGIANNPGYMMGSNGVRNNGGKSYSLIAADDAMIEDYDSENGSNSDEEINVT